MKFITIILVLALAFTVFAQEEPILNYNLEAFQLTQKYSSVGQSETISSPPSVKPPGWKSPGKALMLSMIMPGAGEMYAGSPLKALLFFSIEVVAWTGVGIYQKEGSDKEKQFQDYIDVYEHWTEERYFAWLQTFPTWVDFSGSYAPGHVFTIGDYNIFEEENSFTHQLPSTMTQQYYEMIGKYMTQFGPGWDDSEWEDIWGDGQIPESEKEKVRKYNDDTQTYYWPGIEQTSGDFWVNTDNAEVYQDIRYKSNKALDNATLFAELALINHVISALDAGFTVRSKNRKLETALDVEAHIYNGEAIPMGKITINW